MKLQIKLSILAVILVFSALLALVLHYQASKQDGLRRTAQSMYARQHRIIKTTALSRSAFFSLLVSLRSNNLKLEGESRTSLDRYASDINLAFKNQAETPAPEIVLSSIRSARRTADKYIILLRKLGRETEDFKKGIKNIAKFSSLHAMFDKELSLAAGAIEDRLLETTQAAEQARIAEMTAICIIVLCGLAIPLLAQNQLFHPLERLTLLRQSMENESVTLPVPYTSRKDEIGDVAAIVLRYAQAAGFSREAEGAYRKKEESSQKMWQGRIDDLRSYVEEYVKGAIDQSLAAAVELEKAVRQTAELSAGYQSAVNESYDSAHESFERIRAAANIAENMASSARQISSHIRRSGEFIASSSLQISGAEAYIGDLRHASSTAQDIAETLFTLAAKAGALALSVGVETVRIGEQNGRHPLSSIADEAKLFASEADRAARDVKALLSETKMAAGGIGSALTVMKECSESIHLAATEILSASSGQTRAMEETVLAVQAAALAAEVVYRKSEELKNITSETSSLSANTPKALGHFVKSSGKLDEATKEFMQKSWA